MKKPPKSKPAKAKSAPIPLTLEQLYEAHERNLKGAPTALTPHTYREAIRLYAHGVPETMIGPSLKPALGRTAVKDWLDKGDADAAKGLISIFSSFSNAFREAEPLQEGANLGFIAAARAKDWRAAAWMLEHGKATRDKFAKTTRIVAYSKAELDAMTNDELEKVARGEDPRRH